MVGVLALTVVLLRKGRVSKARLLELLAATMGGLLSSSCCAVQLLLNTVSVGCAGFAVLDRFRPLFLCLTFFSLAYKTVVYDVRLYKHPWRSLPTWLVALALATAPALVRRLNRGGGMTAGRDSLSTSYLGEDIALPVRLQYRVSGMKCEACANGLKKALEALPGDWKADVLFEEGMVFLMAPAPPLARKGTDDTEGAGTEWAARRVLLGEVEEGIADVMEERGYGYTSIESTVSNGEPAAHLQQQQQEQQQQLPPGQTLKDARQEKEGL